MRPKCESLGSPSFLICHKSLKYFFCQVDENMKMAQKRDAVRQGMFYFRKDICKGITTSILINAVVDVECISCLLTASSFPFVTCEGGNALVDGCGSAQNGTGTDTEEYTLMSIDTIINGKVIASSTWNTQPFPLLHPPRDQIECVLCWLCSLTQEGVFPGLIPILNSYLESMEVDVDTRCTILNYLKLIKKRASGTFDTFGYWFSWHFSTRTVIGLVL